MYQLRGERPGPTIAFVAGMHGNEPAGTIALKRLLARPPRIRRGSLIVIPEVNPWGLKYGVRWQDNLFAPDVNRNFGNASCSDRTSCALLRILLGADLVVDLHEGYTWAKQNPKSVGSTVTARGSFRKMARDIVKGLNRDIRDPKKQFIVSPHPPCDIPNTLECCLYRRGIPYMLVETTGQNNIQPIELRINQMNHVISQVLRLLK